MVIRTFSIVYYRLNVQANNFNLLSNDFKFGQKFLQTIKNNFSKNQVNILNILSCVFKLSFSKSFLGYPNFLFLFSFDYCLTICKLRMISFSKQTDRKPTHICSVPAHKKSIFKKWLTSFSINFFNESQPVIHRLLNYPDDFLVFIKYFFERFFFVSRNIKINNL